jgi:hypothetical protein
VAKRTTVPDRFRYATARSADDESSVTPPDRRSGEDDRARERSRTTDSPADRIDSVPPAARRRLRTARRSVEVDAGSDTDTETEAKTDADDGVGIGNGVSTDGLDSNGDGLDRIVPRQPRLFDTND